MTGQLVLAANCSLLFTELPAAACPAAARAAGFAVIEVWWPWPDQPVPADRNIDAFLTAIRDAGVHLVGLNFFAGNLAGPDCGVLSIRSRSSEFRDNVAVTVGIGAAPDVRVHNAPYGNRVENATPEQQDGLASDNSRSRPLPECHRSAFGHTGKVYNGWETRRRREPGFDWAIVRPANERFSAQSHKTRPKRPDPPQMRTCAENRTHAPFSELTQDRVWRSARGYYPGQTQLREEHLWHSRTFLPAPCTMSAWPPGSAARSPTP